MRLGEPATRARRSGPAPGELLGKLSGWSGEIAILWHASNSSSLRARANLPAHDVDARRRACSPCLQSCIVFTDQISGDWKQKLKLENSYDREVQSVDLMGHESSLGCSLQPLLQSNILSHSTYISQNAKSFPCHLVHMLAACSSRFCTRQLQNRGTCMCSCMSSFPELCLSESYYQHDLRVFHSHGMSPAVPLYAR
ncbi:hypothetical protein OBBRIDRAFT_357053 [Obba rivulosa]|uniref:Uncharacterized protein n=1 Tax=Obba rivulosa TaxID=1052685 RepID=A0A8E2DEJ1_9APHY|nr:hypothetical protein OBBRIDRAFT_357053 [Obba rivulosa]